MKYFLIWMSIIVNNIIFAQYNLETCTTDIATDVPFFFQKYFHCVKARMSTSGDYVNLYFNGKPPYNTWYYDGGENDITYNAPGTPACPPGPPSGDCYFQVPNDIVEVDYVISIPVNPVAIDGILKGQNSVDGIFNASDANEYPLGTIGAALNGVNIYNPVAAGDDLIEDEMYGFDLYSGHPDFGGAYHYHSTSQGPLEVLKYKIPNHVTQTTPGSTEIELYGISCDGIVIMGCTELDKSLPDFSLLDAQHGHVHDLIDESGAVLLENRYHTHICYTSFTGDDNTENGYEDHEFNPESAYYISTNTDPNKNACEASTAPYEADAPITTGCTNSSACNYNTSATVDDASCILATGCDSCSGATDGSGTLVDGDGTIGNCEILSLFNGLIPEEFSIHSIYPNPFNPITNITYGIPEYTNVQIIVYDLSGKQVETLMNGFQTPGYHSVNWNADNLPSGVYLIRMDSGEFTQTQKVVLVK